LPANLPFQELRMGIRRSAWWSIELPKCFHNVFGIAVLGEGIGPREGNYFPHLSNNLPPLKLANVPYKARR
jgi:hypothetical protein